MWNIEQEKDREKEKVGGRPAKLNMQKGDRDLASESIRVVALSSMYSKLRFLPAVPYHSDHWRSFQNFNIIDNKMPKFERAILVLRSFFCKE